MPRIIPAHGVLPGDFLVVPESVDPRGRIMVMSITATATDMTFNRTYTVPREARVTVR